jgi:uncharacterized membrane protein YfcA
VDAGKAATVALPALGGVLVGTAVQQRVSERLIAGAFAVLLIVWAAVLVV